MNLLKRNTSIAACLWLFLGLCLIAGVINAQTGGLIPEADAVGRMADLARQKDIVWFSLVAAIVAILFSAWLVRQMICQQARAIVALDKLRLELERRPCVFNRHTVEGILRDGLSDTAPENHP